MRTQTIKQTYIRRKRGFEGEQCYISKCPDLQVLTLVGEGRINIQCAWSKNRQIRLPKDRIGEEILENLKEEPPSKNSVVDGSSDGSKAMHLEIPDLGSFDVEAFPGGFQIFNHNDNLFIDIANLGGEPVMISEGHHFDDVDTRNSETFGKTATWFHYKDGTSRQCYLASDATNRHYSCSPSAFGEFAIQPFPYYWRSRATKR